MSRYTNGIAGVIDGRTRDGAARARRKALPAGVACLALVMALAPFAAESAGDIKFPAGYRSWFHVNTQVIDKTSPLFDPLGGMHNIYVNATGQAALKKGGPYPDKTVFVSDVHDFTVTDGSWVEGGRKAIGIMVKDHKKYASTAVGASSFGWEATRKSSSSPIPPNSASNATSRRRTRTTSIRPGSREAVECQRFRKGNHDVGATTRVAPAASSIPA
jgi:hypothetical protein